MTSSVTPLANATGQRYFDEILRDTPPDIDDVVVEANGEWHTSNNQYGSKSWKAQHPFVPTDKSAPRKAVPTKSPPQTPSKAAASSSGTSSSKPAANVEIMVLDSDDEDEGRVKRELSPSFGSGSSVSAARSFETVTRQAVDDVIDLTLDSDDDEPPPTSKQAGKRKADDAGLTSTSSAETWKNRRLDTDRVPTSLPRGTSSASGDYSDAPHNHLSRTIVLPPRPLPPSNRYAAPHPATSSSTVYNNSYPGRPALNSQLPPLGAINNRFAGYRGPVP